MRWLGEKKAEFAQKYISKGTKIGVSGILCVDNYKDKDGNPKQFTYIMVDEVEFCESRNASQQSNSNDSPRPMSSNGDGFMNIPDGIGEELPFN